MLPKFPAGVPDGVFVKGKAVGDFEFVSTVGKSGRPFQMVKGRVLAGDTFVNVTQALQQGQPPLLFKAGDEVLAAVVPNYKANGVVSVDVVLERPDISKK